MTLILKKHLYEKSNFYEFDITDDNKLFIFGSDDIKILDIESKMFLSKIIKCENNNVVTTGSVNSIGSKVIVWDIWNKLKIHDLEKNTLIDYKPYIKEKFLSVDIGKFQLNFLLDNKFFIYNCENYIEIVNIDSLEVLIKIEDKRTSNTPIFFYESSNNYLFIALYFDIYSKYSNDFLFSGNTNIKILDLNTLNIVSENYFSGHYEDIIYDNVSKNLVAINNSCFSDGEKNITVLHFNEKEKKIEIVSEFLIPDNNIYNRKFIIKNPISNDFFLIVSYQNNHIDFFSIDIVDNKLKHLLNLELESEYLDKIKFTRDGKYLILGFSTGIEIYKVVLS